MAGAVCDGHTCADRYVIVQDERTKFKHTCGVEIGSAKGEVLRTCQVELSANCLSSRQSSGEQPRFDPLPTVEKRNRGFFRTWSISIPGKS